MSVVKIVLRSTCRFCVRVIDFTRNLWCAGSKPGKFFSPRVAPSSRSALHSHSFNLKGLLSISTISRCKGVIKDSSGNFIECPRTSNVELAALKWMCLGLVLQTVRALAY